MKGTDPLDFLASEMYQQKCQSQNTMGVRWLCLREDVGEQYLKMAKKAYESWVADERRAEVSRNDNDPLAFFKVRS